MSDPSILFPVQNAAVWEDPALSLKRLNAILTETPPPADALMILPEMFATGFSMNAFHTASAEAPAIEAWLAEKSRDFACFLAAGVATPEGQNQAVVFNPNGQIIARYAKQRLFTPAGERDHAVPGAESVLFEWRGLKCAPFVCYDLRFPELFREAARRGATCFLVIANWPAVRQDHFSLLLRARAVENQAWVVGVNGCAGDCAGGSLIVDPLGRTTWEAGATPFAQEVPIDPGAPDTARANFPALKDADIKPC